MANYQTHKKSRPTDANYQDKDDDFIDAVQTDVSSIETEITAARNGEVDLDTHLDSLSTRITTLETEDADEQFLDLTDTPSSFSGQASKFLAVNSGETAVEFNAFDGTILGLSDTPSSFSGAGDYYVRINSGATAVVFTDASPATGIPDASIDGTGYVRKDGAWAAGLVASNNLSEVTASTARTNLSVYSQAEITTIKNELEFYSYFTGGI